MSSWDHSGRLSVVRRLVLHRWPVLQVRLVVHRCAVHTSAQQNYVQREYNTVVIILSNLARAILSQETAPYTGGW